jgi:hypothetical protein
MLISCYQNNLIQYDYATVMKSRTQMTKDFKSALYDSLRHTADMLATAVGEDEEKFSVIFHLAFEEPYPMNMRAARVCQLCCMKHYEKILPYLDELPERLEKSVTDGVKRSFLKIYADYLPEMDYRNLDKLAELVFQYLMNIRESIAVRVLSMSIAYKLCLLEPDLKNELMEIIRIESESPHAGMQVRAKMLANKIMSH